MFVRLGGIRFPYMGLLVALLLVSYRGRSALAAPVETQGIVISETSKVSVACSSPALSQTEELYVLTNQRRQERGVAQLTYSVQLQVAAQRYAEVLAAGAKFDHEGPNGEKLGDRVQATGYPFTAIGENLAAGQEAAIAVITEWENNEGHSDNLFSPEYSQVGLGYAEGEGDYGKYWVQVLGNGQCT